MQQQIESNNSSSSSSSWAELTSMLLYQQQQQQQYYLVTCAAECWCSSSSRTLERLRCCSSSDAAAAFSSPLAFALTPPKPLHSECNLRGIVKCDTWHSAMLREAFCAVGVKISVTRWVPRRNRGVFRLHFWHRTEADAALCGRGEGGLWSVKLLQLWHPPTTDAAAAFVIFAKLSCLSKVSLFEKSLSWLWGIATWGRNTPVLWLYQAFHLLAGRSSLFTDCKQAVSLLRKKKPNVFWGRWLWLWSLPDKEVGQGEADWCCDCNSRLWKAAESREGRGRGAELFGNWVSTRPAGSWGFRGGKSRRWEKERGRRGSSTKCESIDGEAGGGGGGGSVDFDRDNCSSSSRSSRVAPGRTRGCTFALWSTSLSTVIWYQPLGQTREPTCGPNDWCSLAAVLLICDTTRKIGSGQKKMGEMGNRWERSWDQREQRRGDSLIGGKVTSSDLKLWGIT